MSHVPCDTINSHALHDVWLALSDDERLEASLPITRDPRRALFRRLPTSDRAVVIARLPKAETSIWMGPLGPDDADPLRVAAPAKRPRIENVLVLKRAMIESG